MKNSAPKKIVAPRKASPSPGTKVFGQPLQKLYGQVLDTRGAPTQPQIIRELNQVLNQIGLSYHPRTIKRQLLGKIEYVPEVLENIFVEWVQKQSSWAPPSLLEVFQKNKNNLESSPDQALYVSPQFFIRMADAYLYLHKRLSRRQLALRLQSELKNQNIQIGLETLQAALGGKTQKIRKVIEDALKDLFKQEGFEEKSKIEAFLKEIEKSGKREIEKVEVGNIGEMVDAYLLKSEGLSKRKLAIRIKERLASKGYEYHLSSIQSVIEGKTRKTKQAILESIYELLKETGIDEPENAKKFLNSLNEAQRQRHHYVQAEGLSEIVQSILTANPNLTRRQLALLLREDLAGRNFEFSLNTLQYILAGKTQRTRAVVIELLEAYKRPEHLQKLWAERKSQLTSPKGRPSLHLKVEEFHQRWLQATPKDRDELFKEFLKAREDLIRKRWSHRHPRKGSSPTRKSRNRPNYYEDLQEDLPATGTGSSNQDPEVAYNVGSGFDRLVS